MNPEVVIGLAGIGGTVGVAWISNHTTRELERYRQRREIEGERAVARQAARLIELELREAETLIDPALDRGAWWPQSQHISVEAWGEYRADLAAAVSDEAWGEVAGCFSELKMLDDMRQANPGWDESRDTVSCVVEDVRAARNILRPYANRVSEAKGSRTHLSGRLPRFAYKTTPRKRDHESGGARRQHRIG